MRELEKAAFEYANKRIEQGKEEYKNLYKKRTGREFSGECIVAKGTADGIAEQFLDGADWLKNNLWKDAQGKELPEIDREVVALQGLNGGSYRIVFAHRPVESYIGKDIFTGKETERFPKRYDKGKWNMPDVKWWLDLPLPYEKKGE